MLDGVQNGVLHVENEVQNAFFEIHFELHFQHVNTILNSIFKMQNLSHEQKT